MSRKPDYSKKILTLLAGKPARIAARNVAGGPAMLLPEFADKIALEGDKTAIKRALKGLEVGGFIETITSEQSNYARLTKEGKKKAHSLKLENDTAVLNPTWDGKWRIILLDLPESRKAERESLRYLLKKAGFVCLKNSAWISPYPFEHLFTNIKKDLGLTTEIMILTTDSLDQETEKILFEVFGK